MINLTNWNYTFYTSSKKKAFISMGAAPCEESEEIKINYLVTVTDEVGNDIFQLAFSGLDQACKEINHRYGHWKLVDARLAPNSDGGCGSCEAH